MISLHMNCGGCWGGAVGGWSKVQARRSGLHTYQCHRLPLWCDSLCPANRPPINIRKLLWLSKWAINAAAVSLVIIFIIRVLGCSGQIWCLIVVGALQMHRLGSLKMFRSWNPWKLAKYHVTFGPRWRAFLTLKDYKLRRWWLAQSHKKSNGFPEFQCNAMRSSAWDLGQAS